MNDPLRVQLQIMLVINILLMGWIIARALRRRKERPKRTACILRYPTPSGLEPDFQVLVCANRAGVYLSRPASTAPPYHIPVSDVVSFCVGADGEFKITRDYRG